MGDDKQPAQATAAKPPEVVAFFTTGDPRQSKGLPASAPKAAKLTNTERFQKRADSLASAGRVHGVNDVQAAIDVIKALPADLKLAKVFLVGHGFDDGYFFHGKPDPQADFTADSHAETLEDPSKVSDAQIAALHKQFIDELAKHCTQTDRFEIGFLSCFAGTKSLISSVCKALNKKGFRNFVVGGYKNDYQTRYIFDSKSGAILEWRDEVLDRQTQKSLVKMTGNQIPAYEVSCKSDNPIDPLDL